MSDYYTTTELIAGAYVAWDSHLGSHFCPTAGGTGECEAGAEILRRLHTALALLDDEGRQSALAAVREWDWAADAPYSESA